jgi:hypothetical protein
MLAALETCYQMARTHHPELPQLVILIGSGADNVKTRFNGRFWAERWNPNDGTDRAHEIVMAGESFGRGPEATLITLLHEAAHALAAARRAAGQTDCRETSRQGRWHNKTFARLARELGLDPQEDAQIGYQTSLTRLPNPTRERYALALTVLAQALTAWRVAGPLPEKKPKAPKVLFRCCCEGAEYRIPGYPADDDSKPPFACTDCGAELTKHVEGGEDEDEL